MHSALLNICIYLLPVFATVFLSHGCKLSFQCFHLDLMSLYVWDYHFPNTLISVHFYVWNIQFSTSIFLVFKPPPPVGASGGYMFSGRPCVHASVIHVVVLCFRDISSICCRIFTKLLSLVHLGTQMTWLRFWVKRSKFKVTPSRRRRTALDATVECNFF